MKKTKLKSEGKIDAQGRIFSNETITEKEGYDAMLYMLSMYWKQTATMINFFNRIDSKPELSQAIKDLGVETVYNELVAAQKAFEDKEAEKVAQAAAKPKSESETAVKELRKAFTELGQFLNIMSQMSGKAEYNEIASKIDQLIEDVNTNVKARNTRRENTKEELDEAIEN